MPPLSLPQNGRGGRAHQGERGRRQEAGQEAEAAPGEDQLG